MTAQEVGLGILVALVLGAALAIVIHLSPTLRRAVYPLLVGSQAVPVVIVAPLLVVWFGFGIAPKLAIIALVCFFPIVVTTLDALAAVDPEQRKLLRTLDASRGQELRWVEVPAALPGALSGAKIAVAVAVIGAVFAEYAGSSEGLGQRHPPGDPAARDRARLRRRHAARRPRHPALRPPGPRRAPARAVGPPTPRPEPCMTPTRRPLAVLLVRRPARRRARAQRVQLQGRHRRARRSTRQLTLVLDYLPNADHVGIFMAQERGEFAKAGLDVRIVTPSDPAAPLKLLAAGRADIAISYEPEILLARDKGLEVLSIGALAQRPLTSLMAVKGRSVDPAKLAGKTVGTAGHPLPGRLPRRDPRGRPASTPRPSSA